MALWFTDAEFAVLRAACERLIPEDETPGATSAGVPDYIDGLLGAFLVDPPRIWAGGPTSGRHGGEAAFARFHRLGRLDELAWRTRIEGSQGIPEREFNGPVRGLQERYRTGLAGLGADFCDLGPEDQDALAQEQSVVHRAALRALLRGHVRRARVRGQPRRSGVGGRPVPR